MGKYKEYLYFIFRILVGGLFLLHGMQKLFSGNFELISLIGLAGIIEFLGGILIVLGLFTKSAALISGIEMLIAYFYAHFPQGFNPLTNQGELALLFFLAFLILFSNGSGKFSLEKAIFKREF
jgi:putative oxidoreductase